VLGLLLLVIALLWSRDRNTWYWLDEGISLGISSHPLSQIPELLRQDASPPLYYMVLHVWTSLFGDSEARTHLLSLVLSLGTIPAALWAGRSLFGPKTGWICAVLAAVNPYIAGYANETRMYSLVVLLTLVGTASFLHSFVYRRRGYLPAFVVSLVLLLYTHNWGLFFAVGAGVAMILCLLAPGTDRRLLIVDAALALTVTAVLYAPWIPTLLYQRAHTGSPSSVPPTLGGARHDVSLLMGSGWVWVALALAAGVGLALAVRASDRTALAVVATAAIPAVTIAVAYAASTSGSAWSLRYLAVVVPPMLLLAGLGLGNAGRPALLALAVIVLLSAPVHAERPLYEKSNLRAVAERTSPSLRSGDLVISPMAEVPLLAHYLPQGVNFATPMGRVSDPRIADWRDLTKRLEETDMRATLLPLIEAVPAGGHVLVVCPQASDLTVFIRFNFRRCDEARSLVGTDPRFRSDLVMKPPRGVVNTPTDGEMLTKQA